MKEINDFAGEYKFLSNFYLYPVEWEGICYPASENAFQATKTLDEETRKTFVSITPAKAKQKGRQLQLRDDWDAIKDDIMYQILVKKFSDPMMAHRLLATAPAPLVEGNWWGDEYWGRCNGVGQNKLGRILMEIRDKLKGTR